MSDAEAKNPTRTVLFSTEDVVSFAGVSYRRIDHWTRIGLLRPAVPARGSGTARRYDLTEARLTWLIAAIQNTRRVPTARGGGGSDLTVLVPVLDYLRGMPWGGTLVMNDSAYEAVDHVLALVDAIASLGPAVTVVDLDRCPSPDRWKQEP